MDNLMKPQLDKLNNIKKCDSFDCKKSKFLINNEVDDITQYLNEINRIENRIQDLDSYLNYNDDMLNIIKNETDKNYNNLDKKKIIFQLNIIK